MLQGTPLALSSASILSGRGWACKRVRVSRALTIEHHEAASLHVKQHDLRAVVRPLAVVDGVVQADGVLIKMRGRIDHGRPAAPAQRPFARHRVHDGPHVPPRLGVTDEGETPSAQELPGAI